MASTLSRARKLHKQQRYADAIPLFETLALSSVDDLIAFGECYHRTGDYANAASTYMRVISSEKCDGLDVIQALLNAARSYLGAHNLTAAEQQLTAAHNALDACTRSPTVTRLRADACAISGTLYFTTDRLGESLHWNQQARSHYESIGDISELYALVLTAEGNILSLQGLHDQALQCARRANEIDPSVGSGLVIAHILERTGALEEAHAQFKSLIAMEEKLHGRCTFQLANLLNGAGVPLHNLRRFEEALRFYQRSHAMYQHLGWRVPTDLGSVQYNIGRAYTAMGKYKEALSFTHRALKLYRSYFPNDDNNRIANCLENIADANSFLGNTDAAETAAAGFVSAMRRSQIQCAAAGCSRTTKAGGGNLDACAGCKRTFYCSVECQRADWKAEHKVECMALRGGGKRIS